MIYYWRARSLTTEKAAERIRLRLGQISGLKARIELDEKDISGLISMSLDELVEKVDTPSMLLLPYSEIIDLRDKKIASIDFVTRAEVPYGVTDGVSLDPFYLSNTVMIGNSTAGASLSSVMQTQAMYAIRAMAQNTVQAELVHFHDLHRQTLMVSYSGARPNAVSIIYRPLIQSVEDLPSNTWATLLVRLASAHGKIIIGRIRTKYTVPGSPVSLGAEILAEGLQELQAIYDELRPLSAGLSVL